MSTVINLATGERTVYSCPPREAVMAAYAQNIPSVAGSAIRRADFQTWMYEERYGHLVNRGTYGWHCGHFSCPAE